eukprot:Em0019g955a
MSARDLECTSGWPKEAVLFHLPKERELLEDTARRLAFEAYLEVSKLPYTKQSQQNADYMSPSGTTPFLYLKYGGQPLIIWNFDHLRDFLCTLKLGRHGELDARQTADMEAYVSVIRTKIIPAETYETWAHSQNVRKHTMVLQGMGLAWPLRYFVPWTNWLTFCWRKWELWRSSRQSLLLECEQGCRALSLRLGNKQRFFDGGNTSCLDMLTYAHLQAILSTPLPGGELAHVVSQFKNLVQFTETYKASLEQSS